MKINDGRIRWNKHKFHAMIKITGICSRLTSHSLLYNMFFHPVQSTYIVHLGIVGILGISSTLHAILNRVLHVICIDHEFVRRNQHNLKALAFLFVKRNEK